MRDKTYEAYKATVVLIALLDTLWTNCRALAKLGRNTHVMTDLSKRFSQLHTEAERLKKQADDIFGNECHHDIASQLLRAARKMNREARVVARFYGIPTKEMTASSILYYGTE